jgi:NitT/TauT family transport system ATP-binding protein
MAIRNASKFYHTRSGAVHALDSVSLDVREGEFLCILGPSGCGKTTLLWSMAGLHPLSSGEIRLGDVVVIKPNPQIAMIFQDANLLPWRNLQKNIELPFELKRRPPDSARIQKLLERVALAGFEKKFPRELSGGMQQRASLCRALLLDPPLLLMDEPFGALDAMTRDELNLELLRVWGEGNRERKTVIFVTHSIPEAVFLADRVVVMTPRPGRLARIFDVPLPRPRTVAARASTAFGALTLAVHDVLHGSRAG